MLKMRSTLYTQSQSLNPYCQSSLADDARTLNSLRIGLISLFADLCMELCSGVWMEGSPI